MPPEKRERCIFSQHHHWNCVIAPEELLPVLALAWHDLYAKQGLPAPEPRGQSLAEAIQQQQQQVQAACPPPEKAARAASECRPVEAMLTGERVLVAGLLAVWAAARLRQRQRRTLRSLAEPLKA